MAIKLKAYANLDDVHLVWRPDGRIPKCLGFKIECRRGGAVKPLSNRVAFEGQQLPSGAASSADFPFQRFDWTDHAADLGDEVAYRVVARVGAPGALADGPASDWTPVIKLTADCGDGLSAYFNRGFVLSQFIARYMKAKNLRLETFKAHIGDFNSKARLFLSGELRMAMLTAIQEVAARPDGAMRAALYELEDEELVAALAALKGKAEVVLANGSVKKKGQDQNAHSRAILKAAGCKVTDRMVSPKPLGHNKFVVFGRKAGTKFVPEKVWTGSTNWTQTGLCTQLNNGLMISNTAVAKIFDERWRALKKAKSAFPKELVDGNGKAGDGLALGSGRVDLWFTRTRQQADIKELKSIVSGARDGVLFVMFKPGAEPVLTLIDQVRNDRFVRGVATEYTGAGKEQATLLAAQNTTYSLDVIETTGVTRSIGDWMVEGSRGKFNSAVGWAITHSKVLVVDPFGADPIVVTGSHNFSKSASESNDENFVVIRNHRKLAEAYAVNCIQTYNHYRWRAYLQQKAQQGKEPWSKLDTTDAWQSRFDTAATKELFKFWIQ